MSDDEYEIIGMWFGWYWNKTDLLTFANVIKNGMNNIEIPSAMQYRLDSVVKHMHKIAEGNDDENSR